MKEKILFINACVRENSRTLELANCFLNKLNSDVIKIDLSRKNLQPLDNTLLTKRIDLISKNYFRDKMFEHAKIFSLAEIILIAAPRWDLSFPAILKIYIENINVSGIVFKYNKFGKPETLCHAKKLFYVTTSGGKINFDFGFEYIKSVAQEFYGIKNIFLIKAEGLDMKNSDTEKILSDAKNQIDNLFINSLI